MSFKNNYIELSKKFGGPYALITKGVKKGVINSIMRGGYPKINEAHEVAKVLGVTMEELLTGNYNEEKIYSTEEQKYINKLIDILRSNNNTKISTTKNFLDLIKRDVWNDSFSKAKTPGSHLKKKKSI